MLFNVFISWAKVESFKKNSVQRNYKNFVAQICNDLYKPVNNIPYIFIYKMGLQIDW